LLIARRASIDADFQAIQKAVLDLERRLDLLEQSASPPASEVASSGGG
jgi:hypothetical protein